MHFFMRFLCLMAAKLCYDNGCCLGKGYAMSMKAIAVAAVKQTPMKKAMRSASQYFLDAMDFMYGTQKRARFTLGFAASILTFGAGMAVIAAHCGCATH
jgi:hypothetical protein